MLGLIAALKQSYVFEKNKEFSFVYTYTNKPQTIKLNLSCSEDRRSSILFQLHRNLNVLCDAHIEMAPKQKPLNMQN